MPRSTKARQPGGADGPGDIGITPIIADRDQAALALRLSQHADWRDRVASLGLPEREARALRIEVLRLRAFHAGARAL